MGLVHPRNPPVATLASFIIGGYDHNYVLFGLGPEAREKVKHGAAFTT